MSPISLCPYVRYAGIMPGVMEGVTFRRAYDCRLFYVLEGKAALVTEEKNYPLQSGAVIYLPTGLPYNIEGDVKTIVLNFDLNSTACETSPKSPKPAELFDENGIFDPTPLPAELSAPVFLENAADTEAIFQECLLWKSGGAEADVILSGLVKTLLGKLLLRSVKENAAHKDDMAQRLLLYIKQNYDKDLGGEELGRIFGYHPYHLNRLFREEYGTSVHQAVVQERIRIAKQLLRRTDLSVEKISETVGFSERTAFFYAFRKQTGLSPNAFRGQSRK